MPRRYSKSECLLNDMYIEKVTFSFSMNRNILGLDFFSDFRPCILTQITVGYIAVNSLL